MQEKEEDIRKKLDLEIEKKIKKTEDDLNKVITSIS